MPLRIYVVGRMCFEAGDILLDEREFPSKQCRLAFAYLVARRGQAVPRAALVEALWPHTLPRSWETAVSAIISNLRVLLGKAGLPRSEVISTVSGCYQLRLPADTWIDLEAATHALDEAEGALRAGDPLRAYGWAGVASAIARRPFLPGESGSWVGQQRAELQNILVRALDCFTEILTYNGELALAAKAAEEAVALQPFRETGYQRLMRVHAAAGNRAEALRAYEHCRALLAEELGVSPAPQTESVYLQILSLS